jgi:hypothetical protein
LVKGGHDDGLLKRLSQGASHVVAGMREGDDRSRRRTATKELWIMSLSGENLRVSSSSQSKKRGWCYC